MQQKSAVGTREVLRGGGLKIHPPRVGKWFWGISLIFKKWGKGFKNLARLKKVRPTLLFFLNNNILGPTPGISPGISLGAEFTSDLKQTRNEGDFPIISFGA